jgi:acyl-CoA thioester hydrolase
MPHPEPSAVGSGVSRLRLRVRFGETDLMGIAHHTSYVLYLEAGRVEWLRRRGVAFSSWAERGLHLPVVDLTVAYRHPARFDDELEVETSLAEVRVASVRFAYRVHKVEGGVLCVEASTRLACVDASGALRRLTPEMTEVLQRSEEAG